MLKIFQPKAMPKQRETIKSDSVRQAVHYINFKQSIETHKFDAATKKKRKYKQKKQKPEVD